MYTITYFAPETGVMKTGLYVLLILIMHRVAAQTSPVLKLDRDTIDYGVIKKGDNGVREIWFTNTGSSPLIINCKSSCGCLVPEWIKEPVGPGKKGWIRVKYDTARIGVFRKSIYVSTNEEAGRDDTGNMTYKSYVIPVTGTVLDTEPPVSR